MRIAPLGLPEGRRGEGERELRVLFGTPVCVGERMSQFEDLERLVDARQILQHRRPQGKTQVALILRQRIEHFHRFYARVDARAAQFFEDVRSLQRVGGYLAISQSAERLRDSRFEIVYRARYFMRRDRGNRALDSIVA